MGSLIALAAVINTGNPAAIKLPAIHTQTAEAHTTLNAAGDTLTGTSLWNGNGLNASTTMNIVPEVATTSVRVASAVAKGSSGPAIKAHVAVDGAIDSGTVERAVRTYFADIPVMIQIARCESQFRQYDASTGEVLRGRVNSADRGVMQINAMYHQDEAAKIGLDILTLEGNMAYARHLYEEQGTQPWISSAPCWAAPSANAAAVATQ